MCECDGDQFIKRRCSHRGSHPDKGTTGRLGAGSRPASYTGGTHAYSVSLSIGDSAVQAGKDACQLGRGVADTVLTNLKARA